MLFGREWYEGPNALIHEVSNLAEGCAWGWRGAVAPTASAILFEIVMPPQPWLFEVCVCLLRAIVSNDVAEDEPGALVRFRCFILVVQQTPMVGKHPPTGVASLPSTQRQPVQGCGSTL